FLYLKISTKQISHNPLSGRERRKFKKKTVLIQNRKVQHSLNLRDAKFFPSGEPTNSPFIERFCRRQKD
ncbi:hypothetical protein J8824_25830, partial [Klebsiella pneumoniae]